MGLTLGQVIDAMRDGRIATTLHDGGNSHFKMDGQTIYSSIAGEDDWNECSFCEFLVEVPLGLVPEPDSFRKFVLDFMPILNEAADPFSGEPPSINTFDAFRQRALSLIAMDEDGP